MARLHPALDHGISRGELDAAAAKLAASVPASTDDELLVGVMKIVAMVSADGCDAHTGAYVWGGGTYAVDSLPLRLWLFDEGMVVVDALPPYRELIGWRIDTVNKRAMADVIAAVTPLVPRDNDTTIRLLLPRFVIIPQVLRGVGIAGAGPIDVGLTRGQEHRDLAIAPVPMREYNAWAGMYGLHPPSDPAVLYLSRMNDALWWRELDGSLLYVQYNSVERMAQSVLADLRTALRAPGIETVVVDIRLNTGGEVSGIDPMVDLFKDPAVDRPGHFFVITGRNTFSAASMFLARIDAGTSAIVTGESMAGCPTTYGNDRSLTLEHSGLVVSVSTLFEIGASAADRRPTIEPELPARWSLAAWMARDDPALAAIRAYRP